MFTPLQHLVSPLVQRYHLDRGLEAARAQKLWPIAVHAVLGTAFPVPEVLMLKDEILWLSMPAAVVAQEIQLSKAALLATLRERLGASEVRITDLRFRLARNDHQAGDVGRAG